MDETPIWADMLALTTVCSKGTKMIPIRTTGHEKNQLTVCLVAKADGTKLRQCVAVPRKKVPVELTSISGIVAACSDNGWVNDDLTLDWIDPVWGSFGFGERILIWDSFKCHLTFRVKEKLKRINTIYGMIGSGCAKLIQYVDVSHILLC